MSTVSAYAATDKSGHLSKTTIERRDPGPHDIAIDIKFAGICHSDIHTVKAEWGKPNYPVVPGHEIAGIVTAVGSDVTKHKVGDHGATFTYNAIDKDGTPTQGGYSQAVVVNENFVVRIPESIPLDLAAPLLCAGITLFSPLRHWKAGADTRLAIIGLGGLGHVGVKLGAAMGADVTVLSQSLKKMEDGLRLGAKHYYATSDRDTFKNLRSSFDLILNTVSANLDLGAYLGLLEVDGTLVELGIPEHPMEVPAFPLALARRSLSGSNIGGIAETQEMLDFCAEHDVTPEIEVIEASYVNEAYERVLASDVRYRFVIDISTL
jgi:uncharacterized zinc-type alcohol dehydrogenase-like protein